MGFIWADIRKYLKAKYVLAILLFICLGTLFIRGLDCEVINAVILVSSNIFALYFMVTFSASSAMDYESGAYRIIFTSVFSRKKIIILKCLAFVFLGVIISLIKVTILVAVIIHEGFPLKILLVDERLLLGIPLYAVASFCLGSFTLMAAVFTRKFSLTFTAAIFLFYDLMAKVVDLVVRLVGGNMKLFFKYLPFPLVFKAYSGQELRMYQVWVLLVSGLVFLGVTVYRNSRMDL